MPPTYNIQKVLFTVVEDPPQNLIFIALSAETSLVVFPTLCTTVFVIFVLVMLPAAVFCCVPSAPHEDI